MLKFLFFSISAYTSHLPLIIIFCFLNYFTLKYCIICHSRLIISALSLYYNHTPRTTYNTHYYVIFITNKTRNLYIYIFLNLFAKIMILFD